VGDNKEYWFKRRRYGWGWRPVSWQAWTAVGLYLSVVLFGAWLINGKPDNQFTIEIGMYLAIVVVASIVLIAFSHRHGPSPKWRWGAKLSDDPKKDA